MAAEFNGRIELDIRDSQPDWPPRSPATEEGIVLQHKIFGACLAVASVVAVGGCTRSAEAPVAEPAPAETATTAAPTTTTAPATTSAAEEPHTLPDYGVVETTKRTVGAGETTCEPETPPVNPMQVRGAAPGSPTVIIGVPDGFSAGAAPAGDVALNLVGPDGMTATVSVTPTTLDAAAAFQKYADARAADYEIVSVSVLPGELCGYSGQELMGTLADKPGQGIAYFDRVVHVWTNDGDFLVAVRVQGPHGTAALEPAKTVLLGDFGIRMP